MPPSLQAACQPESLGNPGFPGRPGTTCGTRCRAKTAVPLNVFLTTPTITSGRETSGDLTPQDRPEPMTDRVLDDDVDASGEGDAEAAAATAKPRWKKLALLIGAPVFAFLLIGGGLWATGLAGKLLGGSHEAEHAEPAPPPKKAMFYDLPDLLVNLNGGSRKTSFLKISISL